MESWNISWGEVANDSDGGCRNDPSRGRAWLEDGSAGGGSGSGSTTSCSGIGLLDPVDAYGSTYVSESDLQLAKPLGEHLPQSRLTPQPHSPSLRHPRDPPSPTPHPLLQAPNHLPKSLRLPPQRHLIDMLPPPGHLRPVRHAHPVRQPVDSQRRPPEGAVFNLGDAEVDGFGDVACGVVDAKADDAGGEEVREHGPGEWLAGPGGWVVGGEGVQGFGHGGGR